MESPPKPNKEATKSNLEQSLAAEKQANLKLQQELRECNTKLYQNELKLKSLKSVIDKNIPVLHETAKLLKTEQSEYVQKSMKELETVGDAIVSHIEKLGASISSSNESVIDQVKQEHSESERNLNTLIAEKDKHIKELEDKFITMDKDVEGYKASVEKMMIEKDELSSKYAGELSDITLKHELELEVETDKAKAELMEKINALEKEIDSKDVVISDKESAIKTLEVKRVKMEEEMNDKFQKEKETICSILGAEYDEKLEKAIKDEQEKVNVMQESLVAELNGKYEREKSEQLAELKESLMVEKTKAVEMTQSTLVLEHTKAADDIKQKLLQEKEADLSEMKEKLESDFHDKLAKFSTEFTKEKEHLKFELHRLTSKELVTVEVQTDSNLYEMAVKESQTDSVSRVETQVQTEAADQLSSSMQTFSCELTSSAVQTDTLKNLSVSMQTEGLQIVEAMMQTEETVCVESCIQTETTESDTCDKLDSDTDSASADLSKDINDLKAEYEQV